MCFAVSNRLSFLALSPTASAVLGAYASFADEEGIAFPAREKVAERAGVHISTVSKATRELQAEGLLTVRRRFNSSSIIRLDVLAIVARAAANGCKLLLKGAAKVARATQRIVSKGLSSGATSLWPKPTLTIPNDHKESSDFSTLSNWSLSQALKTADRDTQALIRAELFNRSHAVKG